MDRRSELQGGDPERDPRPLYVAVLGSLLAIASAVFPEEDVSKALFWMGVGTAWFFGVYWLLNKKKRED